ncbi:MAG TPA: metalloregulator ArsR/SmtB family transcription factor [Candidatus Dormibacteraeota bacterium]
MSQDLVEQAAYRFALLGDPTRLRIMNALMACPELSVGNIARAVDTSRFNASAHLNRLAGAGLVARRRAGTTVYYRVNDVNLPRVCEWMCESLRERAKSLAGAGSSI